MDWQRVEGVIGRLEACTQGREVRVPANDEIHAAFNFLGKHLPGKDARYEALAQMLAAPTVRLSAELAIELRVLHDRLGARMRQDEPLEQRILHVPNHIPVAERQRNLLFAVVLFAYGAFSAWRDDFFVPLGKRVGVHLHGAPAWIMEAATLCAVIVFLVVVVDHYDRRPNERIYEDLGRTFRMLGWVLFALALLAELVAFFSR